MNNEKKGIKMMNIKRLVTQFRNTIETARDAGEFDDDFLFIRFPHGCCGDACELLAQFLLDHGISSYYICGTYYVDEFENIQTHAWLLVDNKTIIDITGDQFKNNRYLLNYNKSIHVGLEDDFHRLFEIHENQVRKNLGIDNLGHNCQPRLFKLYRTILEFIDEDFINE